MVRIYLLRHGHSLGNELNLITGHYNCDLSEVGRRQAELVGNYIFNNVKADAFYSSDLVRAVNTLLPAAKLCGKEIIIDTAFRELSAGAWEGLSFDTVSARYPEEFRAWVDKVEGAAPTDGETWESLYERTSRRMDELVRASEGKTIIICTHGGVIKALQCYFINKPSTYMTEIDWVSNASLSEFVYENGRYEAKVVSYDEYLSDIKTHLPKTI